MSLTRKDETTIDQFTTALYNLYKMDKILSDPQLTRFSTDFKQQSTASYTTDFSLCSDRFFTQF